MTWQHVPHKHQGPHQHKGADDHIYSPKLHNGTFKSQGIATFLGAPYCPPDRNAIRAMSRNADRVAPHIPISRESGISAGPRSDIPPLAR